MGYSLVRRDIVLINTTLISDLANELSQYHCAIERTSNSQEKEEYGALHAIGMKLISALSAQDIEQAKILLFAFSRQVSDSFSVQPAEYRPLTSTINKIKRVLIA